MTTTQRRTRLSPEARRAQFIALGLSRLQSTPLDQILLDDIAADAGVSPGLLFHYFESKHDYQIALVHTQLQLLLDATAPTRPISAPEDARALLRETLLGYVNHVIEYRLTILPLLSGSGSADPRVRTEVEGVRNEIASKVIELGRPLGVRDNPVTVLAIRGWMAFVDATMTQWLEPDGPFSELSREHIVELTANALRGLLLATVGVGKRD